MPERCCSDVQSVITNVSPIIQDTKKGTHFAALFLTHSAGGLQRLLPQAASQSGRFLINWRESLVVTE